MPNTTKPLTALQKFKAAYKKTLLYQVIFHPIRTRNKFAIERETAGMIDDEKWFYIRQMEKLGYKALQQETAGMNDDERYFYLRHKEIFGYKADFKHPKTFNEKIIHRMLYDRNPIYTALADKLKARIYIAHKLQGLTQENITSLANERERERVSQAQIQLNLTTF